MNFLLVDEQCDLNKTLMIHKYLTEQLGDVVTLPMSIDIETTLKFLVDYLSEKTESNLKEKEEVKHDS